MSLQYIVTLEVYTTKEVRIWANDDAEAVSKANKIADQDDDLTVQWVHELIPVHHN